MADDAVIGSGATTPLDLTIAADEVAGKKHQRVKISVGDDGTVADLGPSNPMPITGALTVTGTMPVTVASGAEVDGHSATLGSTTDAAATTTGSVIAQLRRIANLVAGTLTVSGAVTTTPPSNASSNVAQINGVTPLMGAGSTGTGSLRVTLATDQTQLTNAFKVDPSAVTSPVSLASVPSHPVTNAGTFAVQSAATEVRASTGATPTAFTATTSTQVFASNASRKLFTVYNNSDKDLYLMLAAAAASVTSYHVKVVANGGFFQTTDYSGEIRGIMSAAITTGQVNPGEFT